MSAKKKTKEEPPFEIEVSADHFKAVLTVRMDASPTLEEVKAELEKQKITYGVKPDDAISHFLEHKNDYDNMFMIANAKPFTHGKDGSIKFNFNVDARSELHSGNLGNKEIDFNNIGRITNVEKGDVIATIIKPEQGESGTTVFGQELPGEWGLGVSLIAGDNVEISPNKMDYVAKIDGAPIIQDNTLRVDNILVVDGDVSPETGNVKFAGTVLVRGSVMDGMRVEAEGDVIVENVVQSANIIAGRDVIVQRGIITRDKGKVKAGGVVFAKYIENSVVESNGGMMVQSAIINSRLYTDGRVVAVTDEGSLMGGQTLAGDSVTVRNVGSTANPKTYVQVGYRYHVQREYLKTMIKFNKIQGEIAGIQKNYQYIRARNPSDLDTLAELRNNLIKLDKERDGIQEMLGELEKQRAFNPLSSVKVQQTVFHGAAVLIGDKIYPVQKEMRFASFKWDPEKRMPYLTTYDESGKQITETGKPETVLIIDDSKTVREVLKSLLHDMGLEVIGEAEDGEGGLELYKKYNPSLVTCDIAMINMDGITALKHIRKINPEAKVIMISSISTRDKVRECVLEGATDYILKPFVPSTVMLAVKSALETSG
ncbi:MAG: FapA family protein [bacterium]